MERKERKRLVEELIFRIQQEKRYNVVDSRKVYEEKIVFNEKYLSQDDEASLSGLKRFLEINPDISDEDLKEIINSNKKDFEFLIQCAEKYSNFSDEVKNRLGLFKLKIAYDKRFDDILKSELT